MTTRAYSRDQRAEMALATIKGAFEILSENPEANVPAWLQPARERAFETFLNTGFPRAREEDWKYTNLAGFAERSAEYLQNRAVPGTGNRIDVLLNRLPKANGEFRIVFVNGQYRPELSDAGGPGSGIELAPYSSVDAATGEKILQNQPIDANTIIALNTAFLTDGLAIRVADGVRTDIPIHVVFASDGQHAAAQPRLSINIGRNAEALIVQHHIGTGECLANTVTSIDCAEHARFNFMKLQDESSRSMHIANQVVRVATDACFNGINFDLGSQLARNDLTVELHGERAHASLYGLFMANGNRHVDDHLRVDHRAPETTSRENYRGILNDAARGVFNGKIIVHPGADGTDAQMNNRNLLLSEKSEIDTKPELEIYTDDVKCSHGSTTGRLDNNALFYLRTRGVPENLAHIMLVSAFAQEIIDKVRSMSPAFADYLGQKINRQLPENA